MRNYARLSRDNWMGWSCFLALTLVFVLFCRPLTLHGTALAARLKAAGTAETGRLLLVQTVFRCVLYLRL